MDFSALDSKRRKAAQILSRLGADLKFDEAGNLLSIQLWRTEVRQKDLVAFPLFPELKKLSFSDCKADDSLLHCLSAMPNLFSLNASSSDITDAGLRNLKYTPLLEELDVSRTQVTNRGIQNCSHTPKLRRLNINCTRCSDDSLETISKLEHLVALDALQTGVTNAGMRFLSRMKQLEVLSLVNNNRIDDRALDYIKGLPRLKELWLEGCAISDTGVAKLAELSLLEELSIHNCAVTEACLKHLVRLKRLRVLYLCEPISKSTIPSLRKMTALREFYIGDCMSSNQKQVLKDELDEVGIY